MRTVDLVLVGLGNVGRAFVKLAWEKKSLCGERYGLDLRLKAAFNSKGGYLADFSVHSEGLADMPAAPPSVGWKQGLRLADALGNGPPGVLVECTPTDIRTGEPGLAYMTEALGAGWHVAAASKGGLVADLPGLLLLARAKGVSLKYSGATAAALPTLDVGQASLAGTVVSVIEGILTGVTNHILTRMGAGISFDAALKEAQALGIAEPDPSLDVDGWDTACKILLIANSVAGTAFRLSDVARQGIREVRPDDILAARRAGRALKLLGRFERDGSGAGGRIEVGVSALGPDHLLHGISGTNKAIVFVTDTMGTVAVSGGKSDPQGTAASVLKDIINIYR